MGSDAPNDISQIPVEGLSFSLNAWVKKLQNVEVVALTIQQSTRDSNLLQINITLFERISIYPTKYDIELDCSDIDQV